MRRRALAMTVAIAALAAWLPLPGSGHSPDMAAPSHVEGAALGGGPRPATLPSVSALSPPGFTENRGQLADGSIRFYAESPAPALFRDGAVQFALSPGGAPLEVHFAGASAVEPRGEGLLPHTLSFFAGGERETWVHGARSYGEVVYASLYAGIDLRYRATALGIKYEFTAAPGAQLEDIRLDFEGADSVVPSGEGGLVISSGGAVLVDSAPVSNDAHGPVRCDFILPRPTSAQFSCPSWDGRTPLLIDPLLVSTFFGGSRWDFISAVVVDNDANIIVAGYGNSTWPPGVPGTGKVAALGQMDVFISKLDPTGSRLLWTALLGGQCDDQPMEMALDSAGRIVVLGFTCSDNFPYTDPPIGAPNASSGRVFLLRLSSSGQDLPAARLFGGSVFAYPTSLALGPDNETYIAGTTTEPSFPVTPGAFDTHYAGRYEGFVSHFTGENFSLADSSFVGGTNWDNVECVAVDESRRVVIAGDTWSDDLPTTADANQSAYHGDWDGFVGILDQNLSSATYLSYMGTGGNDVVGACALAPDGRAYLLGYTNSSDFPFTSGVQDPSPQDPRNGVFIVFDLANRTFPIVTYWGGEGNDTASNLDIDAYGRAFISGWTDSGNMAQTEELGPEVPGTGDFFVVAINGTGLVPFYSAVFGGSEWDFATDIAVDNRGTATVVGFTESDDFPVTAGAMYPSLNNTQNVSVPTDGVIARVGINAPPTAAFTIVPPNGTVLDVYALNASSSWDAETPYGDLVFRWDVDNDGQWDSPFQRDATWTAVYRTPGNHSIALEVRDGFGILTRLVQNVTLADIAPSGAFNVTPESGNISTRFQFNGSPTFDWEDPDATLDFRWDFEGDGVWDTAWARNATADWSYRSPGDYNPLMEVRDPWGELGNASRTVHVRNEAPVCVLQVDRQRGTVEMEVAARAGCTDLEEVAAGLLLRWDLEGDGTWDFEGVNLSRLSFHYRSAGFFNLTVEAEDGFGASTCATVPMTIENTAPQASFSVSPAAGNLTTLFVANASASSDLEDGSGVLLFRWDWTADGIWDTGWNTDFEGRHRYLAYGTYTMKLQVQDSKGLLAEATRTLTVENGKPSVLFTWNWTAAACAAPCYRQFVFTFVPVVDDREDAAAALLVRWDFEGDGHWDTEWVTPGPVEHRFARSGQYPTRIEVKDTLGDSSAFESTVTDDSGPVGGPPVAAGPPVWVFALIGLVAAAGLVVLFRRRSRGVGRG